MGWAAMASSVEGGGAVGRPAGGAATAVAADAPGTSGAPGASIDVTIILARRILLRNALTSRRLPAWTPRAGRRRPLSSMDLARVRAA
jgi:hypothetical protein